MYTSVHVVDVRTLWRSRSCISVESLSDISVTVCVQVSACQTNYKGLESTIIIRMHKQLAMKMLILQLNPPLVWFTIYAHTHWSTHIYWLCDQLLIKWVGVSPPYCKVLKFLTYNDLLSYIERIFTCIVHYCHYSCTGRYGTIKSTKSILEKDSGKCKGQF